MAKAKKPKLPGTIRGNVINDGYEDVALDSIEQHPRNPRKGIKNKIKESIDTNGFYGAVVVQRSTRYVLAGNHRYLVAKEENWETIPVIWVDVDDKKAMRILLVDNASNDAARYDNEALVAILSELAGEDDLVGTGYDHGNVNDLLEELAAMPTPDTETVTTSTMEDDPDEGSTTGEDKDGIEGDAPTDVVISSLWGVIVEVESEEEQVELLEKIHEGGYTKVRALMG